MLAPPILVIYISNKWSIIFFNPIYDLSIIFKISDFPKNSGTTFPASWRQRGGADDGNVVPTWLLMLMFCFILQIARFSSLATNLKYNNKKSVIFPDYLVFVKELEI
jgi:hypothetical protein